MADKKNIKRFSIEVPEELHKEVRHRALDRNITVTKYVTRALIAQIKKEKSYEVQSEKMFAVPEDDL